jgi:probable O-glycosylation ligase (exosortase A-associated)
MLRLALVGLCYLLGTVLSWRSAAYAAALFLWNDIFQPLGFAKHQGEYPVAWYVLAVLVAAYLVNLARGTFRPKLGLFFAVFMVLVAWIVISAAHSAFPEAAWLETLRLSKFVLPLILIYTSCNRMSDIRLIAAVMAGSVGVWAAQAGVHCLVSGVSIDLGIPDGEMSDRNDFTAAIVGTLPVLAYFLWEYRLRYPRIVKGIIALDIALALIAIAYSNSRGASVGLAITGLAFILFVSKHKFRDFALGAAFVGVAALLLPQSWYDRMHTIELGAEQKESSAQERWMLIQGAIRATTDNPVFGLGPDGWLQMVKVYGDGIHNPHSIYLKVSSELGLPGLALYLGLMAITFFRVRSRIAKARRAKDAPGMRLGMALIMSVIGLLASMTFLNAPFNEYLWGWVCLCNAYAALYKPPKPPRKAVAARPAQPPLPGPAEPLPEASSR